MKRIWELGIDSGNSEIGTHKNMNNLGKNVYKVSKR